MEILIGIPIEKILVDNNCNDVSFDALDKIIIGDCLVVLKKIATDSIDMVITSPPYFQQRDYGMEILVLEMKPQKRNI